MQCLCFSECICAGISLVTNMVILDHESDEEPPNHAEVMETADKRAKDMQTLVKSVIGKLCPSA